MGIDVKEIREATMEAEETMADAATGAIVTAVEAATHPTRTIGKTVRRLEKRGEPVNRSLRRQANRTAEDVQEITVDVVSGNLAERLTLAGIRMARNRARRKDAIGDVLSAGLSVIHRGLSATVDEVGKFQKATEPPARPASRGTASSARRSSSRTSSSRSTSKSSSKSRSRSRSSSGGTSRGRSTGRRTSRTRS